MRFALLLLVACSGKDHMTSESMQKPAEDKPVDTCKGSGHGPDTIETPCKLDGTRCVFPADCGDTTCKVAAPARCK